MVRQFLLCVFFVSIAACAPNPCSSTGLLTIEKRTDWEALVQAKCSTMSGSLLISVTDATELTPAGTLTSIAGDLTLGVTRLTTFSMPALTHVGGEVGVAGNTRLTSFLLPALTTVGSASFDKNQQLTLLEFPSLTGTRGSTGIGGGRMEFLNHPALTTLRLPAVTTVVDTLNIAGNVALTTLEVPVLSTVQGDLILVNNTALRQCIVAALRNQLTSSPLTYSASGNNGMPNTCT